MRPWVRIGAVALSGLVTAGGGYFVYVGYEGSRQLVTRDSAPHGCGTPATLDWPYEAVNYDIALDAALPMDNTDWLHDCPNRGTGTAGTDVVAADGVRIAGWYIPSARGDPPAAATVVLVHGWGGVDKSDMLRYAATLHDEFNLAIVDLRGNGRSDAGPMSLGNLEQCDLRAFIDWLERAKHPSAIGVLGDSGGAAAAAKLARTDDRIRGLVLESPFSRLTTAIGQKLRLAGHPALAPSVAAILVGMALRTGVWPDADPIDLVPDLRGRPLAISYGTADDTDIPAQNAELIYATARAAGADVEIHGVLGAPHGKVVDASPEAYRAWVVPFFRRALGAS